MSSSDEDRLPPLPAPARDPLLDDPAFAELVGPPPIPPTEPAFAEPVEEAVETLPVAQVIRPKAIPVPPAPTTKLAPNVKMPVPVETEPPKPQWFGACSVIGCFGVLLIAAVATLIYIAITLLSNLGEKIGDAKPTSRAAAVAKVPRGPVAPTVLADDIEVPLAGRVDAVARGGGGRFLLMRMPSKRKIHVFDANQGQIVYSIPAGEPGTLFTVGADKIFVCDPMDGNLHRYGLFSGELELTEKLPKDVPRVQALAIGGGTSGPLRLIAGVSRKLKIHRIDTATLKWVNVDDFTTPLSASTPVLVRASENGSVLGVSCDSGAFGIWYGTGNPIAKVILDSDPAPKWAIPSPDGQFLYTPRGVFASNGDPYVGTKKGEYCFPPAEGTEWFLTLDVENDEVTGQPRRRPAGVPNLATSTPLDKASLDTEFPANELNKDQLTAADRIHYWPGAGLVAVLPHTPEKETAKLLLYKLPVVPVK